MKLAAIAEQIGGKVVGNGDLEIERVGAIDDAGPHDLSFIANPKYAARLATTRAGAVIVATAPDNPTTSCILHPDPYYAFSRALRCFYPAPGTELKSGIAPTAAIDPTAKLAPEIHLGEYAVVGANTEIGAGTKVMSHAVVGKNCRLGSGCVIYPHVTIYDHTIIGDNVAIHAGTVIGSDGFGYATHQGIHHKVIHVGRVRIENDVEIGANCTIDRAALGETLIGAGAKIDNLVQIGHNVKVGAGSILVSQVGIAGSTELGRFVVLAGQVGVVGHISIGDGARVGAQSGVSKSLAGAKDYSGSPARDLREHLTVEAHVNRLPQRVEELKKLQSQIAALADEIAKLKSKL